MHRSVRVSQNTSRLTLPQTMLSCSDCISEEKLYSDVDNFVDEMNPYRTLYLLKYNRLART